METGETPKRKYVPAKFAVRRFTRFWDKTDWSLGWGLQTPIVAEQEAVGGRDGTVRMSVGEFL